jgi:hypothetical protein
VLQPAFPTREGRPPRRPPQYQQLSGLLSPPSGFSPVRLNTSNFQVCSLLPQVSVPLPQSPPTREGRPPRRPPQCRCRSTVFHLSRSAPPRLCASQGILWRFNPTRQGRPPRRSKALLPQVSAPAAASTVPLTVLSQVSYRQISDLLNLTIHFVHFFLNKATGCAIHTVLVLRHSPDGALLNSSRSGNQFVAFSRLTNGGSVPSD